VRTSFPLDITSFLGIIYIYIYLIFKLIGEDYDNRKKEDK